MNNIYLFLLFFLTLFCLITIYFKIADRFNIIDKPNERSSHTLITVRGGGIIFPFAVFIYTGYFGFNYPYFLIGLLIISIVSFLDDIDELNGKIRLCFQFIAITLMFIQLGLFLSLPLYLVIPLVIFAIATINAWNFMDGINGMTGGYSLLTIGSLIYIDDRIVNFTSSSLMITIALSLLVFIFYNFRTNARCFAGDVGSVSIAFIIVFLMIQLILHTHNFNYILLILIYGLDSATTVFFRVFRKEPIFDAHRSHLYQYLANEKGMAHNTVSMIYILMQLAINILIISLSFNSVYMFILGLIVAVVLFVGVRFIVEGSNRLLQRTQPKSTLHN